MNKTIILAVMVLFFHTTASPGLAHFGMVIPSDTMVMQEDNRTIEVTLSFSHPFEIEKLSDFLNRDLVTLWGYDKVQILDKKANCNQT